MIFKIRDEGNNSEERDTLQLNKNRTSENPDSDEPITKIIKNKHNRMPSEETHDVAYSQF